MKNKYLIILLSAIVILGAVLRLYKLSDIPPGINRDEGSIGFTAHSLLVTGTDEYGRHLPLSFESFGDWKLPLYIYTVVPFVGTLGMSELAVRLPSAFLGILSVLLIYFLTIELTKDKKLAIIATILAAIEPWSIHLSRVESESNMAVFLTLCGMLCFLKSIQKKNWLIIPAGIFFGLTYFAYAGNHVFTTLLVLGLIVLYFPVLKSLKYTKIGLAFFAILGAIIFYATFFQADRTKISGIGIFGDPAIVHAQIELPRLEHANPNSLFVKIVHNRLVFGGEKFVQNYLNSFGPEFLFIKGGDNGAHNIKNFGNMYLVESIFFYIGFASLFFFKKTREKKVVLLWLLIGPIAASITKDAPHTNRMFAIFPMLPVATGLGLQYVTSYIKEEKLLRKLQPFFVYFIATLFLLNFLIYLDRYFIHFPKDEAANWGIGYKELNAFISRPKYLSSNVVITKPQTSPYIYLLFYGKYDPLTYQKEVVRYPATDDGFYHVKSFGRFEFRDIDWTKDLGNGKILVDSPKTVPLEIKQKYEIGQIVLPDNSVQFEIIQKK